MDTETIYTIWDEATTKIYRMECDKKGSGRESWNKDKDVFVLAVAEDFGFKEIDVLDCEILKLMIDGWFLNYDHGNVM